MNNLLAGMVLVVGLIWSVSCLFFQDEESEIKTKTEIVEAGQKSSNTFAQHKAVAAQKDLIDIQKNQTEKSSDKASDSSDRQTTR